MDATVRHLEQEQRYELVLDGAAVSVLGYDRSRDTVVLLHTATEPEARHRGHASALVAAVVADLEERGLRVVVRCPFVKWYLAEQRRST